MKLDYAESSVLMLQMARNPKYRILYMPESFQSIRLPNERITGIYKKWYSLFRNLWYDFPRIAWYG